MNFHNSVNICFCVCFGRKNTCEWLEITVLVLEEPREGILGVLCAPANCPGPDLLPKNRISLKESLLLNLLALSRAGHPPTLWASIILSNSRSVWRESATTKSVFLWCGATFWRRQICFCNTFIFASEHLSVSADSEGLVCIPPPSVFLFCIENCART